MLELNSLNKVGLGFEVSSSLVQVYKQIFVAAYFLPSIANTFLAKEHRFNSLAHSFKEFGHVMTIDTTKSATSDCLLRVT